MQIAALGETVYVWFAANDTSGSAGDGASAAAHVRLGGAAADAAAVLSLTPTLLSSENYPDGCYEVAVEATADNGFAAGSTYGVFCTLAIDSQNPAGYVGGFRLVAASDALRAITDIAGADGDTLETLSDQIDATALEETLTAMKGAEWVGENLAALTALITAVPGSAMTLADDAITAAKIATGAIDSDALAASAVTALLNGMDSWHEVTITCQTAGGTAVGGINIIVKDADSDVQMSSVRTTDGNGQVSGIGLPDGSYRVVGSVNPAYDVTAAAFTVSGADLAVTVTVAEHSVADPPSSEYCTVFGYVRSVGGTVGAGTVYVEEVHNPKYSGSGDNKESIFASDDEGSYIDSATIDDNGHWSIAILQGAVVDIWVNLSNGKDLSARNVLVPSTATANYEDLEYQS